MLIDIWNCCDPQLAKIREKLERVTEIKFFFFFKKVGFADLIFNLISWIYTKTLITQEDGNAGNYQKVEQRLELGRIYDKNTVSKHEIFKE